MAIPIWKDVIVNIGLVDTLFYRIVLADTSEVIYSGKAHTRPGADYNQVRINDICADYLENVIPMLPNETPAHSLPLTFYVQSSSDGNSWTNQGSYSFLNDWSYNYDYDPTTMGMAFPINGHLDSRMPVVWTGFGSSVVASLVTGGSFIGDFNDDFNNDFLIGGSSGGSTSIEIPLIGGGSGLVGTAYLDLADHPGTKGVVIGGVSYKVVTSCAEYALYYVNAFGGWDCFLIEGNTLEADNLKRYTREAVYDNRDIRHRGTYNYVNEIDKGFTFESGWLLNDQGKRMHHLINSNLVYLYDIADGKMIPVNIVNTTCEYKTYKNQGNRLVNYTIQVQVAQNRIRR